MQQPLFSRDRELCSEDLQLLAGELIPVVADLLPVPARIDFWHPGIPDSLAPETELANVCRDGCPAVCRDILVIPLALSGGESGAVLVSEVNASLLCKMSPEWLGDLQRRVQRQLQQFCLGYVDPLTGLYSLRALQGGDIPAGRNRSMLLVRTIFRTTRAATGLQQLIRLAHFFEAAQPGFRFYLGQGLFCLVFDGTEKPAAIARRLLRVLRREGCNGVHVGFFSATEKSLSHMLEQCWGALLTAERRGPFSLCESGLDVTDPASHPLAMPPRRVIARLQRLWRGLDRFALVLMESEEQPPLSWPGLLPDVLPDGVSLVPWGSRRVFVLCPGMEGDAARGQARNLLDHLSRRIGACFSAGICCWPCLEYPRTATIRNCRKAILHGSFYGLGSCVVFDHLSLNVSGDHFFDEGDYRQAVREYRLGLRLSPDDTNLLNSLGVALCEMNRLREAGRCFSRVLEQNPDDQMALVNLGYVRRLQGREQEAVAFFEQALVLKQQEENPDGLRELALQLGRLYCRLYRFPEAVALFERLEEDWSGRQEFYYWRLFGAACMETGQVDRAVTLLQRALLVYPHDARSISMLGLSYILTGQGDELGLELCRKALAMNEANPWLWLYLGRALCRLGHHREAWQALRRVGRRKHVRLAVDLLRAELWAATGHRSRAADQLNRILQYENLPAPVEDLVHRRLDELGTPVKEKKR
ncbi:tetratricopeptide repeat protein [Desulfolithobacter sp.]